MRLNLKCATCTLVLCLSVAILAASPSCQRRAKLGGWVTNIAVSAPNGRLSQDIKAEEELYVLFKSAVAKRDFSQTATLGYPGGIRETLDSLCAFALQHEGTEAALMSKLLVGDLLNRHGPPELHSDAIATLNEIAKQFQGTDEAVIASYLVSVEIVNQQIGVVRGMPTKESAADKRGREAVEIKMKTVREVLPVFSRMDGRENKRLQCLGLSIYGIAYDSTDLQAQIVPEVMLGLAQDQERIGMLKEATQTCQNIIAAFPGTQWANDAQSQLSRMKAAA